MQKLTLLGWRQAKGRGAGGICNSVRNKHAHTHTHTHTHCCSLFGSALHSQRPGDKENFGPKGQVLRHQASAEAGRVEELKMPAPPATQEVPQVVLSMAKRIGAAMALEGPWSSATASAP